MSKAGGAGPERRSFVLYADWEDAILALTDEQRGQLLRILYAFGLRGEEPGEEETDPTVRLIYAMVRPQMARDREAWEAKARCGSRGGRPGAGETSDTAASAAQAWKEATGRPVTKVAAQMLEKMVRIYSATDVIAAIDEAVLHDVVRLDYVQGVLRRWDEERRTVAEALALMTPGTTEAAVSEALRPLFQRWGTKAVYAALNREKTMHAWTAAPLEEVTAAIELALRQKKT